MTLRIILVLLAASVVLAAQESKPADTNWAAPEKAAEKQNPFKSKPELAAGGKKIFARNCVQCHGDESHGRSNNAPDLGSPAVQSETDGALFWKISSGNSRTGMPSFSALPEGVRWQLVLYIRSLKK